MLSPRVTWCFNQCPDCTEYYARVPAESVTSKGKVEGTLSYRLVQHLSSAHGPHSYGADKSTKIDNSCPVRYCGNGPEYPEYDHTEVWRERSPTPRRPPTPPPATSRVADGKVKPEPAPGEARDRTRSRSRRQSPSTSIEERPRSPSDRRSERTVVRDILIDVGHLQNIWSTARVESYSVEDQRIIPIVSYSLSERHGGRHR